MVDRKEPKQDDPSSFVDQNAVRLLPSEPRVLRAPPSAGGMYELLPELRDLAAVYGPYLESLPEEDQMAVALRLEMEHMRDIFVLDRTAGYAAWATKHPEAHARVAAAKRAGPPQRLVLPPRLDELLDKLPPSDEA
jgi:hypothetical protein